MKIIKNIALWILVICFPLLLISSALGILVNNIGTYNYIINEYKVTLVTAIDEQQLREIYQHWIDYYNHRADTPQFEYRDSRGEYHQLLSEKEVVHLQDVRGLMQLDYTVITVIFVLIIISALIMVLLDKTRWQYLARAIFRGGALTVGLFIIMIFLSICCFDQIFILFHQISFTNEFWILDPSRDYLIMMFPGGFFSDVVIIMSCAILAVAVICGGISAAILKWKHAGL
jgi:integral membrane protein (TIGR01906 family)